MRIHVNMSPAKTTNIVNLNPTDQNRVDSDLWHSCVSNYSMGWAIEAIQPPDFKGKRTIVNFNSGNWVGYTEFSENIFITLPIPTHIKVGRRQ